MDLTRNSLIQLTPTGASHQPGLDNGMIPITSAEDLAGFSFLRLRGIADSWKDGNFRELESRWAEVVVGIASLGRPIMFFVSGHSDPGFEFHIGIEAEKDYIGAVCSSILAVMPDSRLVPLANPTDRARLLNTIDSFENWSQVMGSPKLSHPGRGHDNGFLSRIGRGLNDRSWGLLVLAQPIDQDEIAQRLESISNEIRALSGREMQTVQEAVGGKTIRDPLSALRLRFLDSEFRRLTETHIVGGLAASTFFVARDDMTIRTMDSIFRACLRPDTFDSRPETITCIRRRDPQVNSIATTLMSSRELAAFVRPPGQELPGFQILEYAVFDTDVDTHGGNTIELGVVKGHSSTPIHYKMDWLTGHCLLAGMSHSGKTTSCFSLLESLNEQSIPFLVIEPAKREYRGMNIDGLRIYTIGDDRTSPLRLNPFEVPHGVLPQMHIDYLSALFPASFTLFAPMGEVLELSLHEIYQDLGWDLGTPVTDQPGNFPTLTDLVKKIEEVTERRGYGQEVAMNVRAGLVTRLETMRVGAKGTMLDHSEPFDVEDFLAKPTVVECHHVGNDRVKTFLVGLLLTRLFEHRQASLHIGSRPLLHVTLIEEAHRLLRQHPVGNDPESANPAVHAVEQFANMIAELRAAGEGIIVSDQSPSKLAPDVIRNTNLKLIFRLALDDDKRAVGSAINLDPQQARVLTSLPTGEALVFGHGMDRPVRTSMGGHESREKSVLRTDEDVRRLMCDLFEKVK